ncbi:MAG: hypothetical protein AAGB22_02570, partial [Bacteroidota bacterium]
RLMAPLKGQLGSVALHCCFAGVHFESGAVRRDLRTGISPAPGGKDGQACRPESILTLASMILYPDAITLATLRAAKRFHYVLRLSMP